MITRLLPVLTLLLLTACQATAAERPNFVWLLSEDNAKHFVGLYGEGGAPMPHIEALAEHGLVFEHAFSNAPVCSTARTTLATSCYGPRIGTQYHRRAAMAPMPDGLAMFSAYLREAGYYAVNNHKTDYNAAPGEAWDESSRKATWRKRSEGQPFFFMHTIHTTHEGSLHFGKGAVRNERTTTDPASVRLWPQHPDTPTFRYTYARYLDRHRQIDRQFGQVIRKLEEDGLLEDTFIFYFGDHGGVVPGSKGYIYEVGLHVPLVVRIPENFKHLVDAEPGTRVDGFVSFVDFGPTLLHLAGVDVPEGVDGRPFLGAGVSLAEVNQRDEAFGYADRFDEKYDLVRSFRKGKYKYIRNYQPFNIDGLHNGYRYKSAAFREWRDLYRRGRLNEAQRRFFEARPPEMLFDVEADPFETTNLAGDPAYADVLARMRGRTAGWVKGMPDLSFYPEPVLVDQAMGDPVAFGQRRRAKIAEYVDIADLQLLPFTDAQPKIKAALASPDPWARYWGLIVCSAFGEEAAPFTERAKSIASRDSEPLVRARAAEFLGLTGAADPAEVEALFAKALAQSGSKMEAVLILNSVALIHDVTGTTFNLTAPKAFANEGWVKGRIGYVRQ